MNYSTVLVLATFHFDWAGLFDFPARLQVFDELNIFKEYPPTQAYP